jgi:hypothetical protein
MGLQWKAHSRNRRGLGTESPTFVIKGNAQKKFLDFARNDRNVIRSFTSTYLTQWFLFYF